MQNNNNNNNHYANQTNYSAYAPQFGMNQSSISGHFSNQGFGHQQQPSQDFGSSPQVNTFPSFDNQPTIDTGQGSQHSGDWHSTPFGDYSTESSLDFGQDQSSFPATETDNHLANQLIDQATFNSSFPSYASYGNQSAGLDLNQDMLNGHQPYPSPALPGSVANLRRDSYQPSPAPVSLSPVGTSMGPPPIPIKRSSSSFIQTQSRLMQGSPRSPQKVNAPSPVYAPYQSQPSPVYSAPGEGLAVAANNYAGLYSSSGFDAMALIAKVITRANPVIQLGPIDTSCSFAISDARKPDQPIVYVSDTFCKLTEYTSEELVGRNCRFLQAPHGNPVHKGAQRKFTDSLAVHHLRQHIDNKQETQASLINHTKSGRPFINLVTVIPVSWGSDEVAFFVGFQVDLVLQPSAILEKMKSGAYLVNYTVMNNHDVGAPSVGSTDTLRVQDEVERERRELATIEEGPAAVANPRNSPERVLDIVLESGASALSSEHDKKQFNRLMLDNCADLVHVVSLKGSFLYASAAAERVLEYEPGELVGKTLASLLHPSDLVAVLRELKDSGAQDHGVVTLMYRVRRKYSGYVWLESEGKLHTEAGKGRKCVILTGRARSPYKMSWHDLESHGNGLGYGEWWSKVTHNGLFLYSTIAVQAMIGYTKEEMVGMSFGQLCSDEDATAIRQAIIQASKGEPVRVEHRLEHKTGQTAVEVVTHFYPQRSQSDESDSIEEDSSHKATTIIIQTNLVSADRLKTGTALPSAPSSHYHSVPASPSSTTGQIGSPIDRPVLARKSSATVSFVDRSSSGSGSRRNKTTSFSATASTFKALAQGGQNDNVFDELDRVRGTSWQFELHQLKLTNRKLREEKDALMALQSKKRKLPFGGSHTSGSASPNSDGAESTSSSNRATAAGQRACANCARTTSAEWRTGPTGPKSLCNRCGLRWSKAKKTAAAQQAAKDVKHEDLHRPDIHPAQPASDNERASAGSGVSAAPSPYDSTGSGATPASSFSSLGNASARSFSTAATTPEAGPVKGSFAFTPTPFSATPADSPRAGGGEAARRPGLVGLGSSFALGPEHTYAAGSRPYGRQ